MKVVLRFYFDSIIFRSDWFAEHTIKRDEKYFLCFFFLLLFRQKRILSTFIYHGIVCKTCDLCEFIMGGKDEKQNISQQPNQTKIEAK